LFFISTRYFYPSAGQLDQRYNYYTTDGIFAVTLKAEEASPFKPESDEEKAADEKKDEEKDEKKSAEAKSGDQKAEEKKEENKEGQKVIYKAGPVYGIVDAAPGKVKAGDGKLNLSEMQVRIDPREEWQQVFHEAWRIERDFYWDPAMTGHDWKRIGARYEALL